MKQQITDPKQPEETLRRVYAQTEVILSSIPSILIGVNQEGLVTHWNVTAENAFGVPASTVLCQPFSQCGVPWEFQKVSAGLVECRAKNQVVRVDDISFRRRNNQEGFLGFTIIPLRQNSEGEVEFLLFGADITERKRTEQLKNEFVSMVSHELRTPLTVIKEGVSQVLEGILGEVNDGQRKFLSIALEGIERLGRIVDDLLDISKIESGKLELKRESVDLVSLVKGVEGAFSRQAKERGLEIRTHVSEEKLEIYADQDKVVQVFINLISNALKFTEKGGIDISLADKGTLVECSVSDTGIGIADVDLPKVFGKFQQFYRSPGVVIKGTGLGLAICKGIVESHGGEIAIESQQGRGTKFTFTFPRYTARELFRQYIAQGLKEARRDESHFSLIVFDVENYERIEGKIGHAKIVDTVRALENIARQNLRKRGDLAVKDTHAILVVLPATAKKGVLTVTRRMEQAFEDFLLNKEFGNEIHIQSKVATFPDDGSTEEELLAKVEVE